MDVAYVYGDVSAPEPRMHACDERTVALLGKLCSIAHAGNPNLARRALASAVKTVSSSSALYVEDAGDEASVAASIQRRLVRAGIRDKTGSLSSVRFAEIHERISRGGHLKHYSNLLRLLDEISGGGLSSSSLSSSRDPLETLGINQTLQSGNDRVVLRKLKYYRIKDKDDFQSLSEPDLIRDVLFVSQGIDGKFVKFFPVQDKYCIDPQYVVSPQARELTTNLCEIGWMYRKVQAHVQRFERSQEDKGSIQQAFYATVQENLGNYYRMLALVESKVVHQDAKPESREPKLSLRCLAVMLSEPMQQLRVLAILCDSVEGTKGGALTERLHKMSKHGDTYVKTLVDAILTKVCEPLFRMVQKWMFEGELHDPCGEFFIRENDVAFKDDLWQQGYSLHHPMLPPFISQDVAKVVLRTGKSINFLKHCCNEREWGDFHALSEGVRLQYGQEIVMKDFVAKVAARVDSHLMRSLFRQFRIGEHLMAIKRYLLLSQGDFIQCLMDLSGNDLSEKAGVVNFHELTSILETAIRSSVVKYDDPEILNCLRVQLMPHTDEEYGWDVFSLDYAVESPLTAVFTKAAMNKYLRMFNFLWRLKRVEHALSSVWQSMKPSVQLFEGVRSNAREEVIGLKSEVRRCHSLRNEMAHFCMNLQYYIMFEVLEEGWTAFEGKMASATDLDGLLAAHEEYLGSIVEKAMLGKASQSLVRHLSAIFDLIIRFSGFSRRFQEVLLEASSRRRLRAMRAEMETAAGNWGMMGAEGEDDIDCFPEDFCASSQQELDAIAEEYKMLVERFIKLFGTVGHLDLGSLEQKLIM